MYGRATQPRTITLTEWDTIAREQRWPDGARLAAAWDLAADLATLEQLLTGQPVDVAHLQPDGYRRARQQRLVTLSRPADLFAVTT